MRRSKFGSGTASLIVRVGLAPRHSFFAALQRAFVRPGFGRGHRGEEDRANSWGCPPGQGHYTAQHTKGDRSVRAPHSNAASVYTKRVGRPYPRRATVLLWLVSG